MEEKRRRKTPGPRLGALIACSFWLAVLGWGAFWAYRRHERGEWPWDIGARRLEGIQLLLRETWGAAPREGTPVRMSRPRRVTIHHLGGNAVADLDRQATGRAIRAIQADHMRRRKWNDIGYHYIVDREGRIWEGRPITQTGAHAGSVAANQDNIGVLLLGNFDLQAPSSQQLDGCRRLLEALRRRHGIPRESVLSHNEVRCEGGLGPTSCPGKRLAAWVDRYRRGDVESAGPPAPAPSTLPSVPSPLEGPAPGW